MERMMKIETSRFGCLEIAADRVIQFPLGILGFPECQSWILLQSDPQSCFFWLQSVDDAELAFIVVQPQNFFPAYHVRAQAEEMKLIGLDSPEAGEVFAICNRVGNSITANLQGPLVFNAQTRQARQVVLCDRQYHTRHELCLVEPALAAGS